MPKVNQPHTVIIDFSVVAHELHHILLQSSPEADHYQGFVKAQMVHMMSTSWLGDLRGSEDPQVILVTDSKPYWRSEYLLRSEVVSNVTWKPKPKAKKAERLRELLALPSRVAEEQAEADSLTDDLAIHYKAGRKFPEYSFRKLRETMMKIAIAQKWQILRLPGYEADDLAASVVAINNSLPTSKQHRITLVTVDADWMGLVSPNVTWFCMKGYFPRVRAYGTPEFSEWSKRRLGISVTEPREIWDVKVLKGDKSDNLPIGSPIEVIDLLQPPLEHQIWTVQPIKGLVGSLLANPKLPTLPDPLKAKEYLRMLGIPLVIRHHDPETAKVA